MIKHQYIMGKRRFTPTGMMWIVQYTVRNVVFKGLIKHYRLIPVAES